MVGDSYYNGGFGAGLTSLYFGEGIWTTKGANSREKHENGHCFRAFREISWYL